MEQSLNPILIPEDIEAMFGQWQPPDFDAESSDRLKTFSISAMIAVNCAMYLIGASM
jgi:hypothetical protein